MILRDAKPISQLCFYLDKTTYLWEPINYIKVFNYHHNHNTEYAQVSIDIILPPSQIIQYYVGLKRVYIYTQVNKDIYSINIYPFKNDKLKLFEDFEINNKYKIVKITANNKSNFYVIN